MYTCAVFHLRPCKYEQEEQKLSVQQWLRIRIPNGSHVSMSNLYFCWRSLYLGTDRGPSLLLPQRFPFRSPHSDTAGVSHYSFVRSQLQSATVARWQKPEFLTPMPVFDPTTDSRKQSAPSFWLHALFVKITLTRLYRRIFYTTERPATRIYTALSSA